MANAVRVLGLRDLQRAFGAADKAVQRDMKDALLEAAAPVRSDAQRLASGFAGAGRPWSGMRIGATGRAIVYVAPVERGLGTNRNRHRPRFGTKLMDEAMQPALDRNQEQVARRVEKLLDEVADVWERT